MGAAAAAARVSLERAWLGGAAAALGGLQASTSSAAWRLRAERAWFAAALGLAAPPSRRALAEPDGVGAALFLLGGGLLASGGLRAGLVLAWLSCSSALAALAALLTQGHVASWGRALTAVGYASFPAGAIVRAGAALNAAGPAWALLGSALKGVALLLLASRCVAAWLLLTHKVPHKEPLLVWGILLVFAYLFAA